MKITKNEALRTWDLDTYAGTPQTEKARGEIDKILINQPDKPIREGESFSQFSKRVLDFVKSVLETGEPNTILVTHNSVFGLIKLWDKKGRPKHLDRPFRTEYAKQDSETGDHFILKGKKGDIYVCRHGETEDNLKGNFRSDDAELTEKGVKEGEELGKALSKIKIPEIICSPLKRTVETSQAIADAQEGAEKKDPKEELEDVKKKDAGEEDDEEEEDEEEECSGLKKSDFLYMEPRPGDDKRTFASCGGCRMFLSKLGLCSLHGKDVKIGPGDSCGLFVRGKAPDSEVDHIEASVTKEESGFTEGPVQCQNCHYFWKEKDHNDCLLFKMLNMKDHHVPPNACCNAFSPKKEKEE